MDDSNSWLDSQTREMLQREPPQKIAPAGLPDYSLVLLAVGKEPARMVRAVRRVNRCDDSAAWALLGGPLPVVVNPDLSYSDALLGQFEFVCCDAITVVIPSEVVAEDNRDYLDKLYLMLRRSDEFQEVALTIDGVPGSGDGLRFLDQFLGVEQPENRRFPIDLRVLYKKARIMAYWGDRVGAQVRIIADPAAK